MASGPGIDAMYKNLTALAVLAGAAAKEPRGSPPAADATPMSSAGQGVTLSGYRGDDVVHEWRNPHCAFVGMHDDSGTMQWLQHTCVSPRLVWSTIDTFDPGAAGHLTPGQASALLASRKSAPSTSDSIASSNPEDVTRTTSYCSDAVAHSLAHRTRRSRKPTLVRLRIKY